MKHLYLIYQWLIAIPLLLVATLLTAIVTMIGCLLGSSNFWGYYPGKVWSRLFCTLLLLDVEVEGREHIDPRTSYVFVANHQGSFDIFLIYGYLGHNFKWMMKSSLRRIPFVGRACKAAGFIFVDRGSRHALKATMAQAMRTLVAGMSLVVFPEGSRTRTGEMGRFKRGAYQVAVDLNLPIVPLTINGSYQVMPATSYCIHRGKMKLTIHPPIPPQASEADVIHPLMEQTRQVIASALQ